MPHPTARGPDVVVIGAGAVGLSIAWEAARRGLRPLVLERDRLGHGTSWHAAGMIAPVSEVAPGEEPLLALGLRSARMYPEFVEALCEDAGAESAAAAGIGYARTGTLLVARDADDAAALERERALRDSLALSVARLRPSEARRREPALAPAIRLALELPDDHAVDPRGLVAALAVALRRLGGELREATPVRSVRSAGGVVSGVVLDDSSTIDCDRVVIAAGVWAGTVGGVGEPVPLAPVKGQILRLHDPEGAGLLQRVIRFGSAYIVPRADGRYVIGATSEERGFDTTVTAGGAFTLLRDASELVPGISELALDELTAGLRPSTPDNLPAIGPGSLAGLHWAVGHRRGGILLAPATAALVADALTGRDGAAAEPFAPARFAAGVPA